MVAPTTADAATGPPPTTAAVDEMNEMSQEFNRSLSIGKSVEIPSSQNNKDVSREPVDDVEPSAMVTDRGEEMNAMSQEFNRSHSVGKGIEIQVSQASHEPIVDESSPEVGSTDKSTTGVKHFIAPKDFELLKVIGMGAFGKVS